VIPPVAITAQRFETFPETPAGVPFNELVQGAYYVLVSFCSIDGSFIVGRTRKPDTAATALNRQPMLGNEITNSFPLVGRP